MRPLATEAPRAPALRGALSRALPVALPVALVSLIAAPVLDPGVQLFFRDTGRLHYPVKRYIAERLAKGELPLWYPWSEAGTSLLGQVTAGLFHPFTLLYAVLPFELAFKLNHLLALPMAAIGMYLLARRLASPWGASCAAVAFAGSGYVLSMCGSNLTYALGTASVPLAIWALLRFAERPSAGRLLAGAALLAMPALAGEPQSMLLAGMIGALWAIGASVSEAAPSAGVRARRAARAALLVAAWGATGLLLSGPASAPAAARLSQTSRAAGVPAMDLGRFATHPARLPGLLVPEAFDDTSDLPLLGRAHPINQFQEYFSAGDPAWSASILIGAPALLLACAGAARRRGRMLLLGAAVFLLASTGDAAGVQDALIRLVPGLRYFRYAEKLVGPATLLLAAAAAVGADVALAGSRRAALAFATAAGAAGAALLGGGALARAAPAAIASWLLERGRMHAPPLARSLADALATGALLAGGLALAMALVGLLRAARDHRGALPLGALACAAAALLGLRSSLPCAPIELFHGRFSLADELVRLAGPSEGRWRLYTPANSPVALPPIGNTALALAVATARSLAPQFEAVARIEGVSPYFSATDALYVDALLYHPRVAFQLLNVRFAAFNAAALTEPAARARGYHRVGAGYWLKDLGPSPRAFLVDGARALPTDAALRLLGSRGFDVRRTAVLPASAAPLVERLSREGSGDAGGAELQAAQPERVLASVDAKGDALLLLSMHWDGGWRARVDGRPAPVVRADLALSAVPVPAGRHRVELEFHPEGLRAGVWMLAAGLLLCCGPILIARRKGRT